MYYFIKGDNFASSYENSSERMITLLIFDLRDQSYSGDVIHWDVLNHVDHGGQSNAYWPLTDKLRP